MFIILIFKIKYRLLKTNNELNLDIKIQHNIRNYRGIHKKQYLSKCGICRAINWTSITFNKLRKKINIRVPFHPTNYSVR